MDVEDAQLCDRVALEYDAFPAGLVARLGLSERVKIRDGYVTNEAAALLFAAADGAVLPYRSATQSGVM